MLKLVIGNKAYSSWSQRAWLACKLSGLPFEEQVVPMWTPEWTALWQRSELAITRRQVPVLIDGEMVIWDSLAIISYLADQVGAARFWPVDPGARALAQSICAEMHAGFLPLRNACSSNYRKIYPPAALAEDVAADVARITFLWESARRKHGASGDFLFGSFGAADIMYAPVVGRFLTYGLPTTPIIQAYIEAVRAQPFVAEWYEAGAAEVWVIAHYER